MMKMKEYIHTKNNKRSYARTLMIQLNCHPQMCLPFPEEAILRGQLIAQCSCWVDIKFFEIMRGKTKLIPEFPSWRVYLFHSIATIFKLLGLAPFNIVISSSVKISKKQMTIHFVNSVVGTVYNLLLSLYFFLIVCLYLPTMSNRISGNDPFIELSYEIGLHSCANGVAMMIILIYCFRQQSAVAIFNQLFDLEDEFINELYDLHQLNKFQSETSHEILITVTHIFINIALVVSEFMVEKHPPIYLLGLAVPGFFIASFLIQYTLIVMFLKKKFYHLNKLLSLVANPIEKCQSNSIHVMMVSAKNHQTIDDVMIIRRTQRVLYEISCNLTEFYSLPTLLAIVLASLQLVYHCYFFIAPFVLPMSSPVTTLSAVNAFIWIIKDVFPVVVFTMNITQALSEIKKTSDIVYNIMAQFTTQMGMQYELEQFSVELLHRNVSFMAGGLFELDGRLLKSIFSTMITYMVILLQVRREVRTSSYNNHVNGSTSRVQ